jgi:type II secretory pathway pseudopilin PulG
MRSIDRSRARQRGMTLLETLIVVGIAAAVIGGIVFMMQRVSERERSEVAVRMQGQEMANLAKAARTYGNTVGEDWADGDRVIVPIDDLVDAGLLPEGFGARDLANPIELGYTPLGQQYTVISIKDGGSYDDVTVEDGTVRTVILDLGDPVAGRLERAGVPNLEQRILSHKEAVSLYTAREERIPMGVLETGVPAVRGVGRSFNKDVLDWIENPPSFPAAVALVGFPDLDPAGTNPTPPGGGGTQYADCVVHGDHEGCGGLGCVPYTPPTCSAPWVELARPRLCGLGGTTVTSTPVGIVVGGLTQETTTIGQSTSSVCTLSRHTLTAATVSLNGAQIYRGNCSTTMLSSEWAGTFPNQYCASTTTGTDEHPGVPGNPAAYGVLCCLPRD